MSEILGDVDDGVEYLRSVGGVQGRLGGWQLQPTLEFELVAVLPHTHCVRTESSEILLLYSYIVIPIHLLMYILIQTNTTYVYTLSCWDLFQHFPLTGDYRLESLSGLLSLCYSSKCYDSQVSSKHFVIIPN